MEVEWRRVGAYALCRDDAGRLLLTRFCAPGHPDHGRWTMPGGGMEWGESPAATASRELFEETGLTAEIGDVAGVFSRWYTAAEAARGDAGHMVGVVYRAVNVAGSLLDEFGEGTTDAAAWFTLEEVEALPRVELVEFVLGLLAER